MPVLHCPKCARSYDVPGVIAVRLASAIATCRCGEWLAGSKAAVLARMVNPGKIQEIDLEPYAVAGSATTADEPAGAEDQSPFAETSLPRSLRMTLSGAKQSVDTVFTIGDHPLWIGRKGCHVNIDDAGLSLRHCSISLRGSQLVLRDADSHMGTFLDGKPVIETDIPDGVHLVRAGSALLSIEATDVAGEVVEPVHSTTEQTLDESELLRKLQERKEPPEVGRPVLICVNGPLNGQEFEIPHSGLVVGREGHVRVPDEFLSRRHFEVLPQEDGSIQVRDLGSRNGTFLNTLPARNTRVQPGDQITAGNNTFRIERRT